MIWPKAPQMRHYHSIFHVPDRADAIASAAIRVLATTNQSKPENPAWSAMLLLPG